MKRRCASVLHACNLNISHDFFFIYIFAYWEWWMWIKIKWETGFEGKKHKQWNVIRWHCFSSTIKTKWIINSTDMAQEYQSLGFAFLRFQSFANKSNRNSNFRNIASLIKLIFLYALYAAIREWCAVIKWLEKVMNER